MISFIICEKFRNTLKSKSYAYKIEDLIVVKNKIFLNKRKDNKIFKLGNVKSFYFNDSMYMFFFKKWLSIKDDISNFIIGYNFFFEFLSRLILRQRTIKRIIVNKNLFFFNRKVLIEKNSVNINKILNGLQKTSFLYLNGLEDEDKAKHIFIKGKEEFKRYVSFFIFISFFCIFFGFKKSFGKIEKLINLLSINYSQTEFVEKFFYLFSSFKENLNFFFDYKISFELNKNKKLLVYYRELYKKLQSLKYEQFEFFLTSHLRNRFFNMCNVIYFLKKKKYVVIWKRNIIVLSGNFDFIKLNSRVNFLYEIVLKSKMVFSIMLNLIFKTKSKKIAHLKEKVFFRQVFLELIFFYNKIG